MNTRIGFIGLGAMGVAMAANIIKAGYPLTVLGNRRREPVDRLVQMGASEANSPEQLIASAEIVVVCVTTSEVVETLVLGENGLFANRKAPFMLIDCGTSDPGSTATIGATLHAAGCSMLDVPLGRSAAALLETMSENLFHVGPLGMGHKLKLINNAYSMSVACLAAETIRTARAAGVDLQQLYEVMAAGPNRSDFFDWMFAAPLEGDEAKLQFSIANGCKDVGYFNRMANASGADAQLPIEAHKMMQQLVDEGFGDSTVPGLVRLFDR